MHVFVDTNILLSFYRYSSDDLEEVRKLVVAIREGQVKLYLPKQVVREFHRNRDTTIAEALKRLRDQRFSVAFPQMSKDFAEFDVLQNLLKDIDQNHSSLLNKLSEAARNGELKADKIINQLLDLAEEIPCPPDLVARARLRSEIGDPPGKKGSLGDAINWEALLAGVPAREQFYFVSGDKDYSSALDEDDLDSFLESEWRDKKQSVIVRYSRLSAFFRDHFPEINLADELEKNLIVEALTNSNSFQRTHVLISKLSHFTDFTSDQANALATAMLENSQVLWILEDPDVLEFAQRLLRECGDMIDPDTKSDLTAAVEDRVANLPIADDDIPF